MYEDGVFIPNEISRIKDLDALLRCGICYEYMKTSMITSCSHNYCSLCIRKSLMYKAQCPACFEEAFDYQLRNNRILDDIIEVYVRLSDEINTFLQKYKILSKTENKVNTIPDSHLNPNSVSELREKNNAIKKGNFNNVSPARIDTFRKLSESVNSPTTSSYVPGSEISNSNDFVSLEDSASVIQSHQSPDHKRIASKGELLIPSMFSPRKKHNTTEHLVPCPVCNVDILEKNINIHLDACLKRSEKSTQNISPSKVQRRRPLPKLVYQLLQEKELRKRLKQQGLSTHGDCKSLINRHQRFTLLYNSECDTLNPMSTADIIKQIEKEEQEERKVSAATFSSKFKIDRKTDPKLIEQVQQQYIQQNKSSFDNLIQSIRKRGAENKMEVKRNLVLSDEKDESVGISGDSDKETHVQKVAGNKAAIQNDIIVSDDNLSENGNSMYAPSTSMTPTNKTRLAINVGDIEDTCDMSYEVDINVSPVLGRNTVVNCSTRENERHSERKSIQNLTLDMFEEDLSRSSTQKCSPPGQQAEEVESNVVSDADSNQSFSLLAESTQEAPFKSEQRNVVTKADEKLSSRRMPKRFNSQLDDPDFEPDSEDMIDDFEIRKPPFRRERKSPKPSSSKEVRILRKRVKR